MELTAYYMGHKNTYMWQDEYFGRCVAGVRWDLSWECTWEGECVAETERGREAIGRARGAERHWFSSVLHNLIIRSHLNRQFCFSRSPQAHWPITLLPFIAKLITIAISSSSLSVLSSVCPCRSARLSSLTVTSKHLPVTATWLILMLSSHSSSYLACHWHFTELVTLSLK